MAGEGYPAANAVRSFKCRQCGAMFTARAGESTCPICGFTCSPSDCEVVDASDEDY